MIKYIPKAALVAEIEGRIEVYEKSEINFHLRISELKNILSFINTLEVKEVDLEEEIDRWQGCEAFPEGVRITPLPKAMEIVKRTAKHFFELGLKTMKKE